jgi:hypothetical protein
MRPVASSYRLFLSGGAPAAGHRTEEGAPMDGLPPSPKTTDGTALDQARALLDCLDEAPAAPAQVADTLDAAVALLRDALQASAPD